MGFRKRCMKTTKKDDVSEPIIRIPGKELAEITLDSSKHGLNKLRITITDLRARLSTAHGYLQKLMDKNAPDILFDADFDFNIMKKTRERSVTADIAIATNTIDKDGTILIINVKSCVKAIAPEFIINNRLDMILADYGLYCLSGVIRELDLTGYGVIDPITIPTHLEELKQEESVMYDGLKVKYQL